jgi:lysophospholipase L1-like esterase
VRGTALRRWHVLLLAALALFALACNGSGTVVQAGASRSAGPPRATGPAGPVPSSMAALGDSITAGFGSCLAPTVCLRNSWSTGDGTRVDSHYRRILRANPQVSGHAPNFATPRARASDLAGQAAAAVRSGAAYVTVLIGANDACRGGIGDMTDPATFRSQVDQGLATLASGLPQAHILVVSIPDIYRLWQIGHASHLAVSAWSLGICPALLANPTSTAAADVDRRNAFNDRVTAYNNQLAAACAADRGHCRYDGGAVHRVAFTIDMISATDFFHPNATGQGELARVSYPGTFTW